jgi:PKD repeat protein
MKPSLMLTLFFAAVLSACAGGNSTPTAPSQPSNQPPSVQQSNPLTVALAVSPNPAVANEATTFIASASSSARATLDFGDGTQLYFGPLNPVNSAELKHIYARAGSFTATLSVTNAAGDTASASAALVVR